jgi:hypothetical protein
MVNRKIRHYWHHEIAALPRVSNEISFREMEAKLILLFRETNGSFREVLCFAKQSFRENKTKLIEMVPFDETDEKDQTKKPDEIMFLKVILFKGA